MIKNLLICGLIAGMIAGVLAAGFASIFGEPPLDAAIAYEEASSAKESSHHDQHSVRESSQTAQAEHSHGTDATGFTRTTQKTFGLSTAMLLFGASVGGLFALIFAAIHGRLAKGTPTQTVLWLAAAAFVVIYLVPFLKYPATPPGGSVAETVGNRTSLYLAMLGLSLVAALAAARVRVLLTERAAPQRASWLTPNSAAIALFIALVGIVGLLLPGVNEIPKDFPATTLWDFRVAAIGTQVVLWGSIGMIFSILAGRVLRGESIVPKLNKQATLADSKG